MSKKENLVNLTVLNNSGPIVYDTPSFENR